MHEASWGLLGPEILHGERRTRTLGVGAAVRGFNDLAVPGMGGVWFAKPLVLAVLGIEVARCTGQPNIKVANAVEALGCWYALEKLRWVPDPRVRGAQKMLGNQAITYARASKGAFYVTQPMRQQTVQPLGALGLVTGKGERFSAFHVSDLGEGLLHEVYAHLAPYKKSVTEAVIAWVRGSPDILGGAPIAEALSTIEPLPASARDMLRDIMMRGGDTGATRRRAALAWVAALRQKGDAVLGWRQQPTGVDDDHWRDLRAGGRFFVARDAAITLLDSIEGHVGGISSRKLALKTDALDNFARPLADLRHAAERFLAEAHDPTGQKIASAFCHDCVDQDPREVLARLVERDGRVLVLRNAEVVPGPAFKGNGSMVASDARSVEDEGQEAVATTAGVVWPEGISHRIRNLFLLSFDLDAALQSKLDQQQVKQP